MTTLGRPAAIPAVHAAEAAAEPHVVVLGVDTHKDVHVAAVLDHLGRLLSSGEFPATAAGYRQLLYWARGTPARKRCGPGWSARAPMLQAWPATWRPSRLRW
ncbi:hypothetical protein AQJ54_33030 [Streptomyces griseorubiginosus]|uniref:Uncharacterized protein n=1 Tax=Streptomyces griseorubiginosus TaxID=67304 RepID=A0A101RUG2_9ACTN|nr:hypothetical protein AQJ54_33030 [Streptomyces griseorubiginosus]